MGSCLTRHPEPAQSFAVPAQPDPAPEELAPKIQYHQRYTKGEIEVATLIGGRKPIEGTRSYLVNNYTSSIYDITNKVKRLPGMLAEIYEDYNNDKEIMTKIGSMRLEIDLIRRAYENFFLMSAWQIDGNVRQRKELSTRGYFTLEALKDIIEGIARRNFPDFPGAIRAVEEQVYMAVELMEHYLKTGPDDADHGDIEL